ncbi:MAG: hypothetical protein CMG74_13090 [Candidatus Marinimicrobia bacterium]|nr:hypothetical protein [Candidatus Neomarinimicrobiota bacterium]|tara:strand:+ start:166 stop:1017 length:852 start_codon:yes stop_codon:yes gene_type:complete
MNKKNKVLKWQRNEGLLLSEDYQLNNNIADKLSKKGFEEICKKYTHITPDRIFDFLKINPKVWNSFSGKGVDLGGGVGLLSSIVATNNNVDHIYCIEITENSVNKCHPIVIDKILGKDKNKVISVIGDFDFIELKNSSVDFIIAWDALHHSVDVIKTLTEAKRVLKKHGKIILVDRVHNNSTSDKEIQRMLNVQYDKFFLVDNYLPEDKILTRRDNGEHEYKFNDWEFFFEQSKLKIEDALIVKEKCNKNFSYTNDAGIKEIFVDYSLGGFERRKIIYILNHL